MIRTISSLFFLFIFLSPSYSQNPAVNFNIPTDVCLNENILIKNITIGGVDFQWTFCHSDLKYTPTITSVMSIAESNLPTGLKMIEDNGKYYGFVSNYSGNNILRLDFGLSLNNVPVITNLGNIGGLLNIPEKIELIKDKGVWFGIVLNQGNNNLIRLKFLNGLESIPEADNLGGFDFLARPRGIAIAKENGNYYFVINNAQSTNRLVVINFGNSLSANASLAQAYGFNFNINLNNPFDLDLVEEDGLWYAVSAIYSSNKLYLYSFENGLTNKPSLTDLGDITRPLGVKIHKEKGSKNKVAYITTESGRLYRYIFLNSMNGSIEKEDLSAFEELNNNYGISFIETKGIVSGFTINTNKKLFKISFPNNCQKVSQAYSELYESPTISYSAPGTYDITLTATDENGNSSSTTKQITVQDQQAPKINFVTDNLCLDNSTTFTAQNLTPSQTLTSHTWDFGDGTTATGPEVTHQYAASGTYKVRLSVEADGGCGNFIEKEVHIYEAPEPEFSFPTAVLCTNGAIVFENLTPGEYNEDITWLWDFGDGTTSTERSPSHVYTTGGTKTVTLTAAIPGCEASISHDIAITVGPSVNFSADNLCFGEMVRFTNLTTGDDITGYVWDFGNGESSTLENPTVTYDAAGVYEVSLTANNTSGCSNTFFKTVTIRDLPDVDFDHAMACSGSPTPFQDRSTVGDGNISSWFWDFGDGSTATEKNPTHVFSEAGTYEVKLIATSSYGCVDSTMQTVLVKAAPKADFTVEVGCPGTLSRFTDASIIPENDQIVGWVWVINSATFYSKNPEIPFSQSGAYEVKLTVNSSNGCSSTITKTVVIDPLPTPDFTVGNVCTGDKAVFTDISQGGGSDEIVDWQWQIGAITSNEQHPEVIFPQAENVSVRLTVTTARGCTASAQKVIKVNALPHAAFTVQKSFGAPPLQVNFKNNTSGAVSYQWLFGDPENSTSSEENPSFVYTTLGRYEAKLVATNAAGCNDTASVFIETLIPVLDVALEQLNTYTTQGDMQIVLKIVNKGSITIDNMDITLDLGGQLTLKEQFSGSILAEESLNYPLGINILEKDIAKVPYICASISINNVEFVEDDKENNSACREIAEEFVLLTPYPNPINDLFHINFVMPEKAPVRLMLMDMLGKKVMDMELQATKVGYNEYSLDFSSLTAGSYVMKISHQNNMYLRKVMVK